MPNTPVAVQVLPMSPKDPVFNSGHPDYRPKSADQAQRDFFLGVLPAKQGKYLFPTSGLNANPGKVVLFQYQGHMHGSQVCDGGIHWHDLSQVVQRPAFIIKTQTTDNDGQEPPCPQSPSSLPGMNPCRIYDSI